MRMLRVRTIGGIETILNISSVALVQFNGESILITFHNGKIIQLPDSERPKINEVFNHFI